VLQDALVIQTGCSECEAEQAALGQGALSPPPGREAHVAKWKARSGRSHTESSLDLGDETVLQDI
jgi:hypothetical protein